MPPQDNGRPEARPGATVAQLRNDIDSGRTGDKVAGFDPAIAPLGTDEEAGGTPDNPALIAQDRLAASAGRPLSARANAASPELAPDARAPSQNYLLPILAGLGAAALLGVWLILRL